MKYLADNLKFLREKTGLNQAEMSHRFGFSRTVWNNYENKSSVPSLRDFIKISKYFGVSEYDLLHKNISAAGNLITPDDTGVYNEKSNASGNVTRNPVSEITENNLLLSEVAEPGAEYKVGKQTHPQITINQLYELIMKLELRLLKLEKRVK